jgi:hypothetical protein
MPQLGRGTSGSNWRDLNPQPLLPPLMYYHCRSRERSEPPTFTPTIDVLSSQVKTHFFVSFYSVSFYSVKHFFVSLFSNTAVSVFVYFWKQIFISNMSHCFVSHYYVKHFIVSIYFFHTRVGSFYFVCLWKQIFVSSLTHFFVSIYYGKYFFVSMSFWQFLCVFGNILLFPIFQTNFFVSILRHRLLFPFLELTEIVQILTELFTI